MYRFFLGELPSGFQIDYPTNLFNLKSHRMLQTPDGWISFYILSDEEKSAKAGVHFCLAGNQALSPYRSPFGGYEINSVVDATTLSTFIEFVEEELKNLGATTITIKLPSRLLTEASLFERLLGKQGFGVNAEEKAAMLRVSKTFDDNLYYSEKGRLKKLIQHQVVAEKIEISQWKDVYQFIQRCHAEKRFPMSMSQKEMEKLIEIFPDRVWLFRVTLNAEWMAASICVRTTEDTIYDFYHNHASAFDSFSPVVILFRQMNEAFLQEGIEWIDMGTSMLGSEVNQGLQDFKLRLGAKECVKYTLSKNIA
jgi:Acetyltransferase (GNAT) domain